MNKDIYILGIGHNTPVYIDLVLACGYTIVGLYHYNSDRIGESVYGYPILGSYDDLWAMPSLEGMSFALSQGDIAIRASIFQKILNKNGEIPILIHPSANVSQFSKLGKGVVVHINSVVHPDVEIGDNTVLSYNVSITHSTTLGKNCYLAGGALIGAYINIKDNVFVGMGATLISGKVSEVGACAYIGAGALVTKAVDSNVVIAGSPAKVIRKL